MWWSFRVKWTHWNRNGEALWPRGLSASYFRMVFKERWLRGPQCRNLPSPSLPPLAFPPSPIPLPPLTFWVFCCCSSLRTPVGFQEDWDWWGSDVIQQRALLEQIWVWPWKTLGGQGGQLPLPKGDFVLSGFHVDPKESSLVILELSGKKNPACSLTKLSEDRMFQFYIQEDGVGN